MLTQQAPGRFRVAAATRDDDLGHELIIGQLVSPLWPVLLKRTRLRWSVDGVAAPPLPFAGDPGWRHIYVRGLPFPRGTQGLLVIGSDGGPFDDLDESALDLVSHVCALAADNGGLRRELGALGRILTAAVNVAARTVDARAPQEIRTVLLEGLVQDMGMAAAVLWEPVADTGQLQITHALGVPAHIREALDRKVSPTGLVARLHRADLNVRLLRGASVRASKVWPGMWVRLVRVGPPAAGVLGVYTEVALPESVDAVLATLSQALSRAVHHAILRERTQRVADTLVAELRPGRIALPDNVDIGYVYRSATRGVPIGGDFFDWFVTEPRAALPDGGPMVGVVCGDVSGKGLEAASLTAMAVYSLRAFALSGRPPGRVLTQLNTTLCNQTTSERYATVAYAMLASETGRLLLSLAGHPLPVLVRGDTAQLLDTPTDVPTGMFPARSFVEHETMLEPGDSLVLVTDGVTEARRPPPVVTATEGVPGGPVVHDEVLLGEQRLVEALQNQRGVNAQQIADRVWSLVVDWTGGATTDDCAVVVLHRTADPPG